MLEAVRAALRIKTTSFNDEITSLISACKQDLALDGITAEDTDQLYRQAVILYCKANFGFFDEADKFMARYEALKIAMGNSSTYTSGSEDESEGD